VELRGIKKLVGATTSRVPLNKTDRLQKKTNRKINHCHEGIAPEFPVNIREIPGTISHIPQ